MRDLMNLKGWRFGRLVVIERLPNKHTPNGTHRTMWLCQCDCGKQASVVASNLRRKDRSGTQSCGCLRLEAIRSKDWLGVEFRRWQKHEMRTRGLHIAISMEQFHVLIIGSCAYCGQPPKTRTHVGGHVKNGIDRINNEKPYEIDNCVSCCSICNRMKSSWSKEVFLKQVERIHRFQCSQTKTPSLVTEAK